MTLFVIRAGEAAVAQQWPDGGAWILATTSARVGWRLPAAALAAASAGRVAALVLGDGPPGDRPTDPPGDGPAGRPGDRPAGRRGGGLPDRFATVLRARDATVAPLSVGEAAALVRTLHRTHRLVLVVGVPGLLLPVNRAGWTVADLAAAVGAPVVVATGAGPDATNHTALALGALDGRGLRAAVVVVGGAAGTADELLPGLSVAPAGHVPAEAVDDPVADPDEFAAAARRWLNPLLHAGAAGSGTAEDGQPARASAPPVASRAPTSGRRAVLLLAGAFVTMSLIACGLGFCGRPTTSAELARQPPASQPRAVEPGFLPPGAVEPGVVEPWVVEPWVVEPGPTPPGHLAQPVPAPTRAVAQVCPEHRPGVRPTTPDGATVRRVDAAWRRIEDWLAAHAPRSRRALRPPAAPAAIAALQRQMSVAFPPDLVASLRRHDGATDFGFDLPFLYTPAPVDRIAGEWRTNCTVLAGLPELDGGDWWHPAFVPFASSGDGGSLLVDQRPGSHGRVGEFFAEDGVNFDRWPASVADLLEGTARSLETGRPYEGRYRPRVGTDGTLDWEIL